MDKKLDNLIEKEIADSYFSSAVCGVIIGSLAVLYFSLIAPHGGFKSAYRDFNRGYSQTIEQLNKVPFRSLSP
jgi:hypothetical protein